MPNRAFDGRHLFRSGGAGVLALAVAMALAPLPLAAQAARTDSLYSALLESKPTGLPPGSAVAQVERGPMDVEDQNAGMLGNVQVMVRSADPTAKFNYLVFPNSNAAATYLGRFGAALAQTGAAYHPVPYLPQAQCAATDKGAVCATGSDRVVVFSFGSRVEDGAAPLMRAALDHLESVERSSGLR
ncbi:MAG: hypothetical protein ACOY3L_04800 [Pseudomonadota bacterium]